MHVASLREDHRKQHTKRDRTICHETDGTVWTIQCACGLQVCAACKYILYRGHSSAECWPSNLVCKPLSGCHDSPVPLDPEDNPHVSDILGVLMKAKRIKNQCSSLRSHDMLCEMLDWKCYTSFHFFPCVR